MRLDDFEQSSNIEDRRGDSGGGGGGGFGLPIGGGGLGIGTDRGARPDRLGTRHRSAAS